jgi:predicted ABC-type sugar transport system permease subunit
MIVGHFGVAYGVRALDKREPDVRVSLLWLLTAAIAPDLLDGVYALTKYCNSDGVMSHSLPAVAILAVVFGAASFLHTRNTTTALVVAGTVLLHLPPDYITGHKPLWLGGPVVGLYIYQWSWLDFLIEVPVIVGGWWMLRRTRFTPSLAVSGLALAVMLSVQGAIDLRVQVKGPHPVRACTR